MEEPKIYYAECQNCGGTMKITSYENFDIVECDDCGYHN